MNDKTPEGPSMVRSDRWPRETVSILLVIMAASALGFTIPIIVPAILDTVGGDDGASSPVAAAVGGMLVIALWQFVAIVVVSAVAGWLIGRSCVVRPRVVLLGLVASLTLATTLGGIVGSAEPQSLARGHLDLETVEVLPIIAATLAVVVLGAVGGYAVAPRRDSAGS